MGSVGTVGSMRGMFAAAAWITEVILMLSQKFSGHVSQHCQDNAGFQNVFLVHPAFLA